MKDKIKSILGSIRFWIVTLTAVLAILQAIVTGDISLEAVFETVKAWLIAVVAIGSADSIAEKMSNK